MEEEIADLTKKRDLVVDRLNLFKTYMANLDHVLVMSTEIETRIFIELEFRLDRVRGLLEEFEEFQNLIESKTLNKQEELQKRGRFENDYYEILSRARCILDANRGTSLINQNAEQGNGSVASQMVNNLANIKLPQIQLPKFTGSYETWLEFRETFDSLIHTNSSIGDIQKFHYLRAALDGDAKQIIHSLEFTADSYKVAWELLCKRYDNKRLLVQNHIKAVYDIPAMTHESSVELRKMLDTVGKHLRSLDNLGLPTTHWDALIIFTLASKLDRVTIREWESFKSSKELPTLEDFKTFIKGRADLLETLEYSSGRQKVNKESHGHRSKSFVTATSNSAYIKKCWVCGEAHKIINCNKFLEMTASLRVAQAKRANVCLNCLKANHYSKDCTSGQCKHCNFKHNSLLHGGFGHGNLKSEQVASNSNTKNENNGNEKSQNNSVKGNHQSGTGNGSSSVSMSTQSGLNEVLLSTAIVQVWDSNGRPQTTRALLDSASQLNFISYSLCNKLGLKTSKVNNSVTGIGQVSINIKERCSLTVKSCNSNFQFEISCFLIPKISDSIPYQNIDSKHLDIPNRVKLADPEFYMSNGVDLLLGASIFWKLICVGQINLGTPGPVLQNTRLGWIVSGQIWVNLPKQTVCNFNMNQEVQDQLVKFWEIEEPHLPSPVWSSEETLCEELFANTTTRAVDGKFVVRIPLKKPVSELGNSRDMAVKRFYSLENRLSKNAELKASYCKFMAEYEQSGHMSKVNNEETNDKVSFFLPHHGVINENSSTTRLRVVFDGSAVSDSGVSLNDIQLVGPSLQQDLVSILLRFRGHKIVVCADIAKMYRNVWLNEDQRCLQQIFWRPNPHEELGVYKLNTVTFGLASSPFLAIRCLQQLAKENRNSDASEVIKKDFYVDDLLSGGSTVDEAVTLCTNISKILSSGGFTLRKWNSNSKDVLAKLGGLSQSDTFEFGDSSQSKTLGLYWSSEKDTLKYNIGSTSKVESVTKRTVLSEVAQIFDPLGLLSACIILPKILLQKLWMLQLSWDAAIPENLELEWKRFRSELHLLNTVQIPRWVLCDAYCTIELHGFADASEKAFGACLYIRSLDSVGNIEVHLLMSKSKVAPLKSLTIPKLELCAALVLAQLVQKVKQSMNFTFDKILLWSDSSVVLSWIKSEPSQFQIFVANRVCQIPNLTHADDWHHVRTNENPADLVSRGVFPSHLINNNLWFKGPSWLALGRECWPEQQIQMEKDLPERKKRNVSLLAKTEQSFSLFSKYSSLVKLKRIISHCLRFINNCKNPHDRQVGGLSVIELDNAFKLLIKISQRETYYNEINLLEKQKSLRKSGLVSLNPFLDEKGLLRVGGRLHMSSFPFDKKHPMLISGKHILAKLIFQFQHLRLMHAGPQLLLATVRETVWVIGGRNLAKKTVHECVRCFRVKPRQGTQIMGVLPQSRVTPQPPFFVAGVDYAGPFLIKNKLGRGSSVVKAYVCLFICFTTHAVHLELVTGLSTEAFIGAFRRFAARRGKPQTVWSDNGGNFIGANSDLLELGSFLNSNKKSLENTFSNDGVQWKFIPAHSPNFGGLWEAGVKSCKYHLKRVMANSKLTYEDFSTVLTQIESILNSRPITPLSPDPSDLEALSPSHFLIGRRLISLPDPDVTDIVENRLSRFQKLQQLQQQFWVRWSKEYVSELQQRVKWKTSQNELTVNALVLIKDERVPPLCWQLGRVTTLHKGPDGVARVATVRTATGLLKRSFSKLCKLPVEQTPDDLVQ